MKSIIAWFARNHVAANLLMGLIILAGLVSLPQMPMKAFPDIDIPIISISVPYLGAAPEEVEQGVCVRIEEELEGIEGVSFDYFSSRDVVRHPLVQRIVEAYDTHENQLEDGEPE